ncbi:hypothetical protein KP509_29G025000 [Ceratopteris richardii]|nr:hypothetical protein KP509_29G025000 [Ceratopteris richardii]
MQAGSNDKETLHLRYIHRNSMESPARKEFPNRAEEIEELIAMDQMRVEGFSAGMIKWERADFDGASQTPSSSSPPPSADINDGAEVPSPAPGPLSYPYEDFLGRLFSGASFPGNVGQYFVKFAIGSPPQTFFFIADTGSDLVWVPCSLCSVCSMETAVNGSSVFHAASSSTFSPIKCSAEECGLVPPPTFGSSLCILREPTSCTYGYSYSDSSQTTGVFAYDTITMSSAVGESVHIDNVAFGCGTNNSGPSITGIGGVIGLGQGPISFTSQVGFMFGSKFSYCFTSFFNRNASSALVFGDEFPGLELLSPKQYTPFLVNPQSETFYYVDIEGFEVEGERLPIRSQLWRIKADGTGGAVIDSGTTLTFFVEAAYKVIIDAIAARMSSFPRAASTAGLPICYNVSGVASPRLPQITIAFKGGSLFQPPAENYFLSPKEDVFCPAFLASTTLNVLGNLLQQNYLVEYDRLRSRLGFAQARCSLS